MKLAYLTGPVDQAADTVGAGGTRWYAVKTAAEAALVTAGYDVYRPDRAFENSVGAGAQRANSAVIGLARAGVVLLPAGVPTLGCPVEIEQMLHRKIPVLIVTDVERSSQIDDWILRGVQVCRPDEVAEWVLGLVSGISEQTPMQELGTKFAQMAAELRAKMPEKRPLTFEPVDLPGRGVVQTTTGPQHLLPTRGYSDDAGLDLYVAEDILCPPHQFVDVPSGVKLDVPAGCWAMITGRSSTLRKRGLLVAPGVIDAGWTGPLFAGVQNLTDEPIEVEAGERLAQLILLPAPVVGYEPQWGRVPEKARGDNGFGSTGA